MSSWRTRATVNTGLHVRRATGLAVAEREESFTRNESVARWSREGRAACEAEREALVFDFFLFFFLTGCKVFQSGRKYLHERGRGFFSSREHRFHFHCFRCAAVPCCAFVHTSTEIEHNRYLVSKEDNKYPTWGMYARTTSATRSVCGFRAVFS